MRMYVYQLPYEGWVSKLLVIYVFRSCVYVMGGIRFITHGPYDIAGVRNTNIAFLLAFKLQWLSCSIIHSLSCPSLVLRFFLLRSSDTSIPTFFASTLFWPRCEFSIAFDLSYINLPKNSSFTEQGITLLLSVQFTVPDSGRPMARSPS